MSTVTLHEVQDTHEWVDVLLRPLFDHEDKRVARQINEVIEANDNRQVTAGKGKFFGFIHDGEVYRITPEPPTFYAILPPLSEELVPSMQDLVEDAKSIARELVQIRQTFSKLLMPCNTLQDVRNTLPECVVACTNLSSMDRTADPAWTIRDDQRAMKAFERLLPRIEFYATTRLFY